MEIFYTASPHLLQKSAIALGFFDGVHFGHQAVINKAIETAKLKNIPNAVVTFKDHPRALTHGKSPLLLTTIEQRLKVFEELKVEAVLILTFTEELCRLSAREYVQTVLIDSVGAKHIAVGYNHHFGRRREGNPEILSKFGTEMNFAVQIVNPVYIDGIEVSSSKIRECLEKADLETANKLLSRPFSLQGNVVHGDGRGAKLGFPTANLQIQPFQMIPANGVYAAKVRLIDKTNEEIYYDAVLNIGNRPTFLSDTNTLPIVEVHILNFTGDLYGKNMEIYFYKYIRSEKKFSNTEELQKQIKADCLTASQAFATTNCV